MLCYMGKPESKDLVSAYMWWVIAASRGDDLAQKNLRLMAPEISEDEHTQALEQARAWVRKSDEEDAFNDFLKVL